MKRLFLLPPLTLAVLLLSACPDTKLPTPAPKVPEPKAETTTRYSPLAGTALNRSDEKMAATRRS